MYYSKLNGKESMEIQLSYVKQNIKEIWKYGNNDLSCVCVVLTPHVYVVCWLSCVCVVVIPCVYVVGWVSHVCVSWFCYNL